MERFTDFHYDLEQIFAYYEPKTLKTRLLHESVREMCKGLAAYLDEVLPGSFEKVMAIYALQAVMMHAQQAIATHHPDNAEE